MPVLWFYAEHDQYIGPATSRLWFDRFHAAGGTGDYVLIPPFPHALGHGVYPSAAGTPLWTSAVATFFRTQQIALPF